MCKKLAYGVLLVLVLGLGMNKAYAILKGADISTKARMDDFGCVYNECGTPKDLLTILKNRGAGDIASIRLFVNPDTSDTGASMDLAYVTDLAQECKNAGMKILLSLHYSDTWTDPGTQQKPAAWENLTTQELINQVYSYTKSVVAQVDPDYVKIGNETNCGMLFPDGDVCYDENWSTYADLINAGVWGAEDGGCNNTIVHVSPTDGFYTIEWHFGELTQRTNEFSIIGISWYPEWMSDWDLQNTVNECLKYKNNVMLVEMADYWMDVGKIKGTEESQYQFVVDCLNTSGLTAAIYWEPAWTWDGNVGGRCLFKPIDDDWQNVEMTKALEQGFGGSPCGPGDCGNGTCDEGEDCHTCPADCIGKQGGPPSGRYCCGDGVCEGEENETNCAIDCGGGSYCGDGTCDADEDQCNCPDDCGTPPSTETSCTDGVDNDCDTYTDCDDSDCDSDPACDCLPKGASCTDDGECCSNKCRGGACKG